MILLLYSTTKVPVIEHITHKLLWIVILSVFIVMKIYA